MTTELALVLKAAVTNSLEYLLFENAIFLVERLCAEVPSIENLYLHATCYFRSGDVSSAYRLLRHHYPFENDALSHPSSPLNCMYLLATCQLKLQRFLEAERTLSELLVYRNELTQSHIAAIYYQMAMCSKALGKKTNALESLRQSLFRDPTLFHGYETAMVYYQVPDALALVYEDTQYTYGSKPAQQATAPISNPTPQAQSDKRPTSRAAGGESNNNSHSVVSRNAFTPHKEIPRQPSSAVHGGRMTPMSTPSKKSFSSSIPASPVAGAAPRPSSGTTAPVSNTIPASTNSSSISTTHYPSIQLPMHSPDSGLVLSTSLKNLLRSFATATRLLWTYRCSDAIEHLCSSEFPQKQKTSGWYLSLLARAHYENAQNHEAAHYWIGLRKREPWRITPTLVHYSTALWHLRREKELSLLTQQLIEQEPHSAITLCVAGNCYSVMREQKMALKMFQRATQVDRYFAYAHVLKGYEHLQLDETSEAEAAFRTALRIESRQYLAIGGLGEVHAREGHQGYARQHFQLALDINPYPPLFARLACAFAEERTVEAWTHAVHLLDNTLSRDPSHLMARHRRADLYLKLGKYTLALQDLEFLKQRCSKEAAVYIALARCHRKLGNKQQAMFLYNHAVDLDDQWSSTAKSEIDKLTLDLAPISAGRTPQILVSTSSVAPVTLAVQPPSVHSTSHDPSRE